MLSPLFASGPLSSGRAVFCGPPIGSTSAPGLSPGEFNFSKATAFEETVRCVHTRAWASRKHHLDRHFSSLALWGWQLKQQARYWLVLRASLGATQHFHSCLIGQSQPHGPASLFLVVILPSISKEGSQEYGGAAEAALMAVTVSFSAHQMLA